MISVETALGHIDIAAQSLRKTHAVMSIPLDEALGYELSQDARAQLTHPPRDMSAMDGYAVKLKDIKTPGAVLTNIGEAQAGRPFTQALHSGEAVRIFTGGVVPNGADTVVIQENTKRLGHKVEILTSQDSAKHIRRAGLDFKAEDILIKAGTRLTPRHIAVAAAGNIPQLNVFRPLKIALLSNGDELKPVGSDVKDGQIINSNGPALTALLRAWGGHVFDLGITPDHKDNFTARIIHAESPNIDADIIIPIGGASVGEHDLAKPVFTDMGYEIIFSKTAIRPGKPAWLAQKQGRMVLGLPGNPASALVCAHIFLRPLLGQINQLTTAVLDRDIKANGPRETYLRGHSYIGNDGQLRAEPFPRQDSGLITPYARANILLRLPPHNGPWAKGDKINVLPIAPLIHAL